MATATVTSESEIDLVEEEIVLTVSDGETYTTGLSTIFSAFASWNENTNGTANPSLSISGRTITVHATGVTDNRLALTVKGNP